MLILANRQDQKSFPRFAASLEKIWPSLIKEAEVSISAHAQRLLRTGSYGIFRQKDLRDSFYYKNQSYNATSDRQAHDHNQYRILLRLFRRIQQDPQTWKQSLREYIISIELTTKTYHEHNKLQAFRYSGHSCNSYQC